MRGLLQPFQVTFTKKYRWSPLCSVFRTFILKGVDFIKPHLKYSTLIKLYAIILINVKSFKIGEIGIMKTALEKYAQTLKGYSADYGRLAVELDEFRLRLIAAEENGVWHETKKIFDIYCKALATLTDLEVRMLGHLPSTNARRRVLEPLQGYVMPLEPLNTSRGR